jgi:hypothetical protein
VKKSALFAAALMSAAAAYGQITVTAPANNSTVATPAQVVASVVSANVGATVTSVRIYVDNVSVYVSNSPVVNTAINLNDGPHKIMVQAWDSKGTVYKAPLSVIASTPAAPPPVIPSTAAVYSNIEDMAGWTDCGACAGKAGQGPETPHTITQYVGAPSLDGSAAQFSIQPTTPYSNALWWEQLAPQPTATNFVYDMWFYQSDNSTTQALEFDVNQSVAGMKYIFGTQCVLASKSWDIYSADLHWLHSGVACTPPAAYTWHHLIWELQRTADNQVKFVALTLDGKKSYLNVSYPAKLIASKNNELNVAFQIDGKKLALPATAWLDRVTLSAW